jgi:phosphatidylserine/phosphatidylglycerophosphate/cardiolipin synthase-like enzyme
MVTSYNYIVGAINTAGANMKKNLLNMSICLFLVLVSVPLAYEVEVYFSPNGYCQEAILREIEAAQVTIDVAMYSFTSEPIAEVLVDAMERGVAIRVLLDKQQAAGRYSQGNYLDSCGIEVRIEDWSGLMHHKFAVIDSSVLLVGSYNWSANAERSNNENLLVIRDDSLSMIFIQEFQGLWDRIDDVSVSSDHPVGD